MWNVARFGSICTILDVENTHGGVLILVKLHTKIDTPP